MICLTKYVTVPVSKGEPNLYDGFWLARVSAVCRSPFCGCAYLYACTRSACSLLLPLLSYESAQTQRRPLSGRCINCKIEISASTIITIVTAPTAASRSLPNRKWFSPSLSHRDDSTSRLPVVVRATRVSLHSIRIVAFLIASNYRESFIVYSLNLSQSFLFLFFFFLFFFFISAERSTNQT